MGIEGQMEEYNGKAAQESNSCGGEKDFPASLTPARLHQQTHAVFKEVNRVNFPPPGGSGLTRWFSFFTVSLVKREK
jgi:hypothetical protein